MLKLLGFFPDAPHFLLFRIDPQAHFLLHLQPDLSLLRINAVQLGLRLRVRPFHRAHLVRLVGHLNFEVVEAA